MLTQLVSFIAIMESQSYRTFKTTKYGDEAFKTIQEYQNPLRLENTIIEDIYFLSKMQEKRFDTGSL